MSVCSLLAYSNLIQVVLLATRAGVSDSVCTSYNAFGSYWLENMLLLSRAAGILSKSIRSHLREMYNQRSKGNPRSISESAYGGNTGVRLS